MHRDNSLCQRTLNIQTRVGAFGPHPCWIRWMCCVLSHAVELAELTGSAVVGTVVLEERVAAGTASASVCTLLWKFASPVGLPAVGGSEVYRSMLGELFLGRKHPVALDALMSVLRTPDLLADCSEHVCSSDPVHDLHGLRSYATGSGLVLRFVQHVSRRRHLHRRSASGRVSPDSPGIGPRSNTQCIRSSRIRMFRFHGT